MLIFFYNCPLVQACQNVSVGLSFLDIFLAIRSHVKVAAYANRDVLLRHLRVSLRTYNFA